MADPKAVIISGSARFTVLTPQLIRMEWSENGIFEDKPSLVFTNRLLPVPAFSVDSSAAWLSIKTDKLSLRYRKGSGRFTPDNLSVGFKLNGRDVKWHPGVVDTLNLGGTTRTLDGTNGEKDVKLEQGLISRSGWSLIDDSKSLLFDNSEWKWAIPRDNRRSD